MRRRRKSEKTLLLCSDWSLALMTSHAGHCSPGRWTEWELPLVSGCSTCFWKVGVTPPGHTLNGPCDHEFRENDQRKGREGEKPEGVTASSHLSRTQETHLPRTPAPRPGPLWPPHRVPMASPAACCSPAGTTVTGWWDHLCDARMGSSSGNTGELDPTSHIPITAEPGLCISGLTCVPLPLITFSQVPLRPP